MDSNCKNVKYITHYSLPSNKVLTLRKVQINLAFPSHNRTFADNYEKIHSMRCPECNTEITNPKSRFCPNCGLPVPVGNENAAEHEQSQSESLNEKKKAKDNPQLSRGMVIFIVAGILFLIVFNVCQYMIHRNDPEYTRTMIDPDSTLADKNAVKFDTLVPDTTKRDSIQRAEKREAEKILNSIRKKPAEEEKKNEDSESSAEGKSDESTSTSSEANTTNTETAPISAPKPKIEQIENE